MKTKWILLHSFLLMIVLFGCSTTGQLESNQPVYAQNFAAFARGEKGFFETFGFNQTTNPVVKGIIVKADPTYTKNTLPQWTHEIGLSITLDNGAKFEIFNDRQRNKDYNGIKDAVAAGSDIYIEAITRESRFCLTYAYYEKHLFDFGSEFYKNGKKKKNLGECSIDVKNYPYNRFYGNIKSAAKSRIYAYVPIFFESKSIELLYLENGEVLCINNMLRFYVMQKTDSPAAGLIINYISSDMSGYCNFNNVYTYEIEDFQKNY